jgi:large subunit ribosomal protein L21
MFAIVKTGGKQYRVGPGDQIVVERIEGDVGTEVALDQVLAISDGEINALGTPTVANASVRAKIVQQPRGTKVLVFKKKRRKNYRRKRGHRQELTVLRIQEISRGSESVVTDGGLSPVASDSETTPAASDVG